VNNFVTLKENFEINPLSDSYREPVKIFENRSYMIPLLCSTPPVGLSSLPCSEFFGVEQWFSEGDRRVDRCYSPNVS
jgi:hypothetical protein